jgi:DNA-binding NarL/FixJ family response regulator
MNDASVITVMLVDDHQLLRESYRALLSRAPDIKVIAEAANGLQALQIANELQPNLIVMDVTMPGMGGIEATRLIKDALRQTKILCLSMHTNPHLVNTMLSAGASGYIIKTCKATELITAIRTVAGGKPYLSEDVSGALAEAAEDARPKNALYDRLSDREKDVLRLMADGHDTKAIGEELSINEKTVFTHRENLMRKLGIDNIAGLTKFAIREGISSI